MNSHLQNCEHRIPVIEPVVLQEHIYNLVPYDSDNIECLNFEEQFYILSHPGDLIERIISMVNLNPLKFDYHNIYVPDRKSTDCVVYSTNGWETISPPKKNRLHLRWYSRSLHPPGGPPYLKSSSRSDFNKCKWLPSTAIILVPIFE